MSPSKINKKYFTYGTRGQKIITNFYKKYSDIFQRTIYNNFEDFSNQIFLSVSNIDFNKQIRNEEAYIIGTIKIQCRVLLDKAIKSQKVIPESRLNKYNEDDPEISWINNITVNPHNEQIEQLDMEELFHHINIFKIQLNHNEVTLFNYLIDEKSRLEIADDINLNLNTLDTQIRRLRIKFSRFLKKSGYTGRMLDKYN